MLTGYYRLARGDAAIQLDCDLRDPPALFPRFLELWEQGHDAVVGIRRGSAARARFCNGPVACITDYCAVLQRQPDAGQRAISGWSTAPFSISLRGIDDASLHAGPPRCSPPIRPASPTTGQHANTAPANSGDQAGRACGGRLHRAFDDTTADRKLYRPRGRDHHVPGEFLSHHAAVLRRRLATGFTTITLLILFRHKPQRDLLGIIGEYVGRIYNQVRVRPTTVIERSLNMSDDAADAR